MKLDKFFIINSIGVAGHPFASLINNEFDYFDGKKTKNAVIGGDDDDKTERKSKAPVLSGGRLWYQFPIA